MGLRVWASLSTKPQKGTSAQKHEKSKLTLSNTNQSVFVLHGDFHVQCLLFKIYPINQQRHSSLHKAAKILRSCSHTEAVSLSDLGIKYTSVVNPQTPQTPKNKDLIQNKKTTKNKEAKNNEDKIKTQKIIRKTSNSMGKGCREGSHLQTMVCFSFVLGVWFDVFLILGLVFFGVLFEFWINLQDYLLCGCTSSQH